MRPATDRLPKPLLPVAGEPFAVHQLRWLAAAGVTDVVYSIGYRGALIRAELGGRELGCSVRFVDEGTQLRGTGGAVRLAVDSGLLDSPFFVLYGDSYLCLDLRAVVARFAAAGVEALMTVYCNDGALDRSNAVFDGQLVTRYDKREPDPAAAGMRFIDYGLSILQPDTVRQRVSADAPSDLADLFSTLSAARQLAGYEASQRFFEIGSPQGLADLTLHLSRSRA
jgi:NDP-sugar pyrophosphorylase family protein